MAHQLRLALVLVPDHEVIRGVRQGDQQGQPNMHSRTDGVAGQHGGAVGGPQVAVLDDYEEDEQLEQEEGVGGELGGRGALSKRINCFILFHIINQI